MKILVLSNKSPLPPSEGGPLAIYNLCYALLQQHRVKIITICTPKFPVKADIAYDFFKKATELEHVFVDTRVTIKGAFLNLFSKKSYNISRFYDKAFEAKLMETLQADNYDIVQLESLYMTPYIDAIRAHSSAKIILRTHNIEYLIWQRITANTSNFIKRTYLSYITAKLKRYETQAFGRVDGIAAITSEDAGCIKQYAHGIPVISIPFGIDPIKYQGSPKAETSISLFHIGSMDWIPNQEGISWFLNTCWPVISKDVPAIKLHLAGRNMPWWLLSKELPNVTIEGEVADARQFMNQHTVQVVPLLSGSGIRIKIIEAMALAKPVIATSIAAEGISYTPGKNILIADTPEEFSKHIRFLLAHPEKIEEIGREAQVLIRDQYSINAIAANLSMFYTARCKD